MLNYGFLQEYRVAVFMLNSETIKIYKIITWQYILNCHLGKITFYRNSFIVLLRHLTLYAKIFANNCQKSLTTNILDKFSSFLVSLIIECEDTYKNQT